MGLYLRRVLLQHPREGWQGSTGISGNFQSEWVATFNWNRWQGSTGISGNFRAEYAALEFQTKVKRLRLVLGGAKAMLIGEPGEEAVIFAKQIEEFLQTLKELTAG